MVLNDVFCLMVFHTEETFLLLRIYLQKSFNAAMSEKRESGLDRSFLQQLLPCAYFYFLSHKLSPSHTYTHAAMHARTLTHLCSHCLPPSCSPALIFSSNTLALTHAHTHTLPRAQTHAHKHTHTRTHTRAHAHTHARTRTPTRSFSLLLSSGALIKSFFYFSPSAEAPRSGLSWLSLDSAAAAAAAVDLSRRRRRRSKLWFVSFLPFISWDRTENRRRLQRRKPKQCDFSALLQCVVASVRVGSARNLVAVLLASDSTDWQLLSTFVNLSHRSFARPTMARDKSLSAWKDL